jgi:hypothetical protein
MLWMPLHTDLNEVKLELVERSERETDVLGKL